MSKVYKKSNPDLEPSSEDIETAVNTARVFGRGRALYLEFNYAGRFHNFQISKRQILWAGSHGYKARMLAVCVWEHILQYPNSFLPPELILVVLMGND